MDENILLISSDQEFIAKVTSVLSKSAYNIAYCKSFKEAAVKLSCDQYHLLISDYSVWKDRLPLEELEGACIDINLISVKKSLKDLQVLPTRIENIFKDQHAKETAKKEFLAEYCFESKNPLFNKMIKSCEKVADSNANILLIGESGSGKEIAAKYIHACSKRNRQPFMAVNCSSYSDTLLESELFGHEQGAFTGAIKSRDGKFQSANKGTLFLDEIGDISLPIQVKLLRTIETKKIERIGSDISRLIDFRLISATNKDLTEAILTDHFREDFFYRISTIVIQNPPLRERKEDLKMLIQYFLKKSQRENDRRIFEIEPEVQDFLYTYDYPGNIRELKNIIDRMVILSENGVITKDGLPIMYSIRKREQKKSSSSPYEFEKILTFHEFKRQSETEYLKWVFEKVGWDVAEAARKLNLSTRQLFNKINEYDLDKRKRITPKSEECIKSAGADVVFSTTECFV
jgi:DNA-binding NtrC family response regulator